MAANAVYPGRFSPAAGTLAHTARLCAAPRISEGTDFGDAWALVWQACQGVVMQAPSGRLSFGYPYDFEPISAVVGRTQLRLDSEDEVAGARKVLMAMIDLCDSETRERVFALAGER